MQFFLEKTAELKIGWNERPLGERDIHGLCRRFKIEITEMPLKPNGFYYRMLGRDFIAVDSKLSPQKKLLVLFHEFAHFLLHVPDSGVTANFHGVGRRTRKECEADIFALCALIPRSWLEKRSFDEIVDEGLSTEAVRERFEIFDRYGF